MSEYTPKKLDFKASDKENAPLTTTTEAKVEKKVDEKPVELPNVAPTIKASEANEPLLQENPHRFVLFPIKYHEVSDTLICTRHASCLQEMSLFFNITVLTTCLLNRSGKCTRSTKHLSGLLRKLICPRTFMIGTTA